MKEFIQTLSGLSSMPTRVRLHGKRNLVLIFSALLLLSACGQTPWNNPYPAAEAGRQIYYTSFTERPKHLDPAVSYSANEYDIIAQIYEPPLQYHFLKRPYTLVPLTATEVPRPT